MKILICISNVPDTTTKVKFTDSNTRLDVTGIQWIINPWDELSLTRALELKDDPSNSIEKVTVVHVGQVSAEPTIRKALAIGADDAIRVNAEPFDAFFTAAQIAGAIKADAYDVILCGIESADFNGSTVGGMLAEFLGIPSVSAVSSLKINNGKIELIREIDGGKEAINIPAPVVAIVQKGITKEPRIPSMRGIMMARSKPLRVVEPLNTGALTEIQVYEMPPPRAACKFVDPEDPAKLIHLLQDEAKVI
jgi:electron transfer flavoprotein beta subunit